MLEYWSDGFPESLTTLHHSITPSLQPFPSLVRQRLPMGFAGEDQNDQADKVDRANGSDRGAKEPWAEVSTPASSGPAAEKKRAKLKQKP